MVERTRNSDGRSFENWVSPQMIRREHWRVRGTQDFPNLSEGFIVPTVYRPESPDEPYDFTVDSRHWQPIFDDWFGKGSHLLITGEKFLAVKDCEWEEDYDPDEPPFIGYVKPTRRIVHEYDKVIRILSMLTEGERLADGSQRFNHWAVVEYEGEEWRCRFEATTPDLAVGRFYRVSFQRRIDVTRFEPYVPPKPKKKRRRKAKPKPAPEPVVEEIEVEPEPEPEVVEDEEVEDDYEDDDEYEYEDEEDDDEFEDEEDIEEDDEPSDNPSPLGKGKMPF